MRKPLIVLPIVVALATVGTITAQANRERSASGADRSHGARVHHVTVPEADRFTPFALTIRAGDSVRWKNNDEDDHTVVSDDAFNTTDNRGTDRLLPVDRTVVLRFKHPGTFIYYCRFHATLDEFNQPVAPGPEGGIQDADGNFGTPMSGAITVLPRQDD
jgi:plastocyanin